MSAFTPNTSCRTATAGAGKVFGRATLRRERQRTAPRLAVQKTIKATGNLREVYLALTNYGELVAFSGHFALSGSKNRTKRGKLDGPEKTGRSAEI